MRAAVPPRRAASLSHRPASLGRRSCLAVARAAGGLPPARPFRLQANIYRTLTPRADSAAGDNSCFKSQAALERRLLLQRIPATGMNTECKYHHISRAASVEILDSVIPCWTPGRHKRGIPCWTPRQPSKCQILDNHLVSYPGTEGNSPAGRPGGTRAEYPCWTPRQPSKYLGYH